MEQLFTRNMPDRDRFDTPLGRKIAEALMDGPHLTAILDERGISHNQFGRWLTENVKWHDSTRKHIQEAFSFNGVTITDQDFEEHKVDRLRCLYEEARDDLDRRKAASQ